MKMSSLPWRGLLLALLMAIAAAAGAPLDHPTSAQLWHVVFAVNRNDSMTAVVHAATPIDVAPTAAQRSGVTFAEAAAHHAGSADVLFALCDNGERTTLLAVKEHRGQEGLTFYDEEPEAAAHGLRGHRHHHKHDDHAARYVSVTAWIAAAGQSERSPPQVHLMARHLRSPTSRRAATFDAPHSVARIAFNAQAATPTFTPSPPAATTAASATVLTTVQLIDLDTQPTVVFLAGGYTLAEKAAFLSDVSRAVKALSDTSSDAAVDATPWPRYISLVNIFAVFQPSAQSGASVTTGPGFSCTSAVAAGGSGSGAVSTADATQSPSCVAATVNNNLGCAYGTPQPRLLSCDYAKVLTLASYAPTADVMVVLVNSNAYGGTGSNGLAVMSNGADLPFLVVHELNHALAGLGDEYSYGYAEPDTTKYSLANCDANRVASQLPWSAWISQGLADGVPSLGCSFDNFYRPTAESCLMRNKVRSMCAVCRQQTTLAIASKRSQLAGSSIGLVAPRCPPDGFQVFLQSDQSTSLAINHYFTTFNTNVTVTWTVPRASAAPAVILGLPSVFVRASDLPVGLNTITVQVTDNNNYLLPSDRASNTALLTQTATFLINRLPDGVQNANCTALTCTSTSGSVTNYCGVCLKANGCTPTVVVTPKEYLPPGREALRQNESIIQIVALVIVLGGIAIVIGAVIAIIARRAMWPSELLVLTNTETIMSIFALVADFLSFALTCALIIVLVYYLPRVPIFGLEVFIALLVFAGVVYLSCAIAYCAIVARWVITTLVTGLIMGICAVGVFVCCAIGFWVVVNSDSDTMISWYRQQWEDNVKSHPDRVCAVQNFLHCSGFDSSCFPAPNSWCPSNCDYQNRNANACLQSFQQFVRDTVRPGVILGFVYCFLLVIGAALTSTFGVSIDRLRKTGRGRRSYRNDPRAPVVPITDAELRAVQHEFEKADKDKSGRLQGKELIQFLRAVFREEFNAADEEAVARAATGANGEDEGLTLDQVLDVYFPTRSARPDPRLLTDEEAEEADSPADLVRLQFRKMETFMQASGALSPEQMLNLHEAYLRNNAGDSAEFVEVIGKAAKQHKTTEEARMCQGLTYNDLEGLRCAWVRIHPSVTGFLTEDELAHFFKLTHEQGQFVSQEHFVRWKAMLDVRRTGQIGWAEFCFPFAQRALLRNAENALMVADQTYELRGQPATLTREQVAAEYGVAYVTQCFLPFERSIPIARVLAASLPTNLRRRNRAEAPLEVTVVNGDDSPRPPGAATRGGATSLYSPR